MALTKDEIKARIVPKLAQQARAVLTWGQIKDAVNAAGAAAKAEIVQAVVDGNARQVGTLMISLATAHLQTLAAAEANTLLADDALTLAELERVL
jgi:hypothetical protein